MLFAKVMLVIVIVAVIVGSIIFRVRREIRVRRAQFAARLSDADAAPEGRQVP